MYRCRWVRDALRRGRAGSQSRGRSRRRSEMLLCFPCRSLERGRSLRQRIERVKNALALTLASIEWDVTARGDERAAVYLGHRDVQVCARHTDDADRKRSFAESRLLGK